MSGEYELLRAMQAEAEEAHGRKLEGLAAMTKQQGRVLGNHEEKLERMAAELYRMQREREQHRLWVLLVLGELARLVELALMFAAVLLLGGVVEAPLLWKVAYGLALAGCVWGVVSLNGLIEEIDALRGEDDADA